MPDLEDAISLAALAHRGQRDKADAPYILHPLRVMLQMETETERMAAVLHDVVEDTPYTLDELRRLGYPEEVLEVVDLLTRREDETYEAFIQRAASHPVARKVKIGDVRDNLDASRIKDPQEKDHARFERYRRALVVLAPGD